MKAAWKRPKNNGKPIVFMHFELILDQFFTIKLVFIYFLKVKILNKILKNILKMLNLNESLKFLT